MEMETIRKPQKSPRLLTPSSLKKDKKYKSLWTSLWSPSTSKRQTKKDDIESPQLSLEHESSSTDKRSKSFSISQDCNESIYSIIEELKLKEDNPEPSLTCETDQNTTVSKIDMSTTQQHEVELNSQFQNIQSTTTIPKEPIYATVNKDKSKILVVESTEENRKLTQKAQELVKNARRKEDTRYAKLQLEITQLEAETRKEVKFLTDRIQILVNEKEVLNEQIDLLQQEKKEILLKNNVLEDKMRNMISSDYHNKIIAEYKKLLNEAKQKHEVEINEYKQKYEILEEANDTLKMQVQELKEKTASYQIRMETLSSEHQKLLQEKNELTEQMEGSKQLEHENKKLLLSLLKVTETLAMERDILLNKVLFQDNQQKELQTTVVDYSLNVGRLQEHISNLSKENFEELIKLQSNKHYLDGNLQETYGKQLDILREKVVHQNNSITELESEKRKLEMQLENVYPYEDAKKYLSKKIFHNI
ncbi:uncharacterized protein CDAR_257281 [Caerostris darwini]|uniref:Uncharacterized protein n=1 Tax=Caerostris darwini TaxID=1538125 RepID=A0AAV4PM22_9ARAC|nr:uncharacterized protein CDAR_257281 [Caerostris darwini]